MKGLVTLCALALTWIELAAGQTRFEIDRDDSRSATTEISDFADKMTSKLTAKWRKANRHMTKAEQNKTLSRAKILVANRYLTMPASVDTTLIHLYLAKKPVGLVMLVSGDSALGMAYVNEAGGIEMRAAAESDSIMDKVARKMREGETYVVSGIDRPWALFSNKDGQEYATDINTGETEAYDMSTLPDYVFTGTQPHKTAAVVGSVIGGLAAVGVIVLVAVL